MRISRISILIAVAASGCAQEIALRRIPMEGNQRTIFVAGTGKHRVTYTFRNTTDRAWHAPELFTSCACHDARFEPATLLPGSVGVLSLTAELEPKGIVEGNVQLRWPDGDQTRLDWSVVLERFRGIQISPPGVLATSLQSSKQFTCAFLASGVEQPERIEAPIVRRGDQVYPAKLQWAESAGSGLAKGEFVVSIPAGAPGAGPLEVELADQITQLEIH